MSELESIIKYDREGTLLDFKREQYRKEKYKDLIKDIMAMANATRVGKRYIITGVKDLPSGDKEFFSIPKEEFVDQATYQQVLRENVEPSIDFSYFPVEVDGNWVGVFEIDNCNNPPYMMKKEYKDQTKGELKKGDCFIRKGSQQERMTRRDLEEILVFRSKFQFHGKITVGFNKFLDKKLKVIAVKDFIFPSDKAKQKIEKILDERKLTDKMGIKGLGQFALTNSLLGINPSYEERSTETLLENLEKVKETYREDDWYHVGEELSEKINLVLKNEGDKYLEDVSIEIKFPSDGIMVMDEIHKEPASGLLMVRASMDFHTPFQYPQVEEEENFYVVKDTIGDLKHHQPEEAFNENLRIFFSPNAAGKVLTCPYTIYAKNLPNPIVGELEIEVE
ncbi:ATP-binding protein [Metabacillus sp. FJAT-53654]|uniref:ATP-binding protein n=1 Tax=Metabacillus rhizosphaerae TaxID=3117747 RepID=A0ABZ2MP94_9BACI